MNSEGFSSGLDVPISGKKQHDPGLSHGVQKSVLDLELGLDSPLVVFLSAKTEFLWL